MVMHPIVCAIFIAVLLSGHFALLDGASVLNPQVAVHEEKQLVVQGEKPGEPKTSLPGTDNSLARGWQVFPLGDILPKLGITGRSLLPDDGNDADMGAGRHLSLPEVFDSLLNTAMFSMDRTVGGALSSLAGPNIEYARSEDGTKLIGTLRLPEVVGGDGAKRKLHIAVVGKAHLRISVETQSDFLKTTSSHTVSLPVSVQKEPIEISSNEDGSVRISLSVLNEKDTGTTSGDESSEQGDISAIFGRPLMMPLLNDAGGSREDGNDEREFVQDLPSAADIDSCRKRFPNEKLRMKQCTCGVSPSAESKALCYGSLISKLVNIARRLDLNDQATVAKHTAIECLAETQRVPCLEKVSASLLVSIYHQKVAGNSKNMSARIRNAIEADDDGPSELKPSIGFLIAKLCITGFVAFVLFSTCLFCAYRFQGTSSSSALLSGFSSVVTQVSASAEATFNGGTGSAGQKTSGVSGSAKHTSHRGPKSISNKISQSHSSKLA